MLFLASSHTSTDYIAEAQLPFWLSGRPSVFLTSRSIPPTPTPSHISISTWSRQPARQWNPAGSDVKQSWMIQHPVTPTNHHHHFLKEDNGQTTFNTLDARGQGKGPKWKKGRETFRETKTWICMGEKKMQVLAAANRLWVTIFFLNYVPLSPRVFIPKYSTYDSSDHIKKEWTLFFSTGDSIHPKQK